MAQTIGLVRGGLLISKLFINSDRLAKNVDTETKDTMVLAVKHVN